MAHILKQGLLKKLDPKLFKVFTTILNFVQEFNFFIDNAIIFFLFVIKNTSENLDSKPSKY